MNPMLDTSAVPEKKLENRVRAFYARKHNISRNKSIYSTKTIYDKPVLAASVQIEKDSGEKPRFTVKRDYTEKIKEPIGYDDILTLYLKEINKIPLLKYEQEQKLAKEAMQGNEYSKEKLIKANLRFVVSIAKKYQVSGMNLIDLIDEGNIGLIIAAGKFDYRRGYHFISYAVWWIRQSVLKAIAEKSRLIRLPLNKSSDIRKIESTINKLTGELGRNPSPDEIADYLDMENQDVANLLTANQAHVSLDSPIGENDTSYLADILADTSAPKPEDNLVKDSLGEKLNLMVNDLTQTERIVIDLRYGLNNHKRMSLERIGQKFGLSKERIRQIEKRAIKRLRMRGNRMGVNHFLDEN